jgi:hypothetical protein
LGTLAFALLVGPLCNLPRPIFAGRMPAPPDHEVVDEILIEPDTATRARWDRAPR